MDFRITHISLLDKMILFPSEKRILLCAKALQKMTVNQLKPLTQQMRIKKRPKELNEKPFKRKYQVRKKTQKATLLTNFILISAAEKNLKRSLPMLYKLRCQAQF